MKIIKLNENQELADLWKQAYPDAKQEILDKALKYDDNTSSRLIRNNEKLLKLHNDNQVSDKQKYNELGATGDTEQANKLSLSAIEKLFNDNQFLTDSEYQKNVMAAFIRNIGENMGLKTAAKVINRYSPEFIKSWADSFNWQAVSDPTEPFMLALNNPSNDVVLNGNKSNWIRMYNFLYDSDNAEYPKNNDAVIYNKNLYEIKDLRDAKQIVLVDMKDNGEHRTGFNKALDNGNYGSILNIGKDLGVKDNDIVNRIKSIEKELSNDEKASIVKALNIDKSDLQKIIQA